MCGIAGFASSRERDGPAMVRALHHRGPDASGSHVATLADQRVFLGHARLSIIDLSPAGNQPMFAAQGRIALVFNGEIYNYRELRREYLADVQFRSGTDTEVLLALYERMGLDCLRLLNGDFAVAILDLERNKLLLIRDRVGVKPLYYWEGDGDIVFGSEIKALLAAGVPKVLARDNLGKYFVFKYVPGNATLFHGIQRLPPGHYLEYDLSARRSRLSAYWQPEFLGEAGLSYGAACTTLRELVTDATLLRLVADVPVGNFLSGGLDSSIVASIVRDQPKIAHYCARQSEAAVAAEGTTSDYDHARRLANDWNLELRTVDIGDAQATLERIRETALYCDDLIADSAQIPTFLITRGASSTSRVFLSGMGADELFLGYAGGLLTLLSSYLERLPGQGALAAPLMNIAQGRGRLKSLRRYLYRLGKYQAYPSFRPAIFSLVGDFETSGTLVEGDHADIRHYLAGYFPPGMDAFDGLKRFEFENFLQKNLAYTDRMAMANSVEVRVPFLDHRVVDLAYSLPRHYKLSGLGRSKRILKDSFDTVLPRYITRRRKAGFAMPIRTMFSSSATAYALLDSELLAGVGGIRTTAIQAIVDRHAAGLEDNSSIIYALISFQEWYRQFFT